MIGPQDTFDLTLTGVRVSDAGEYYCLVNNKVDGSDVVQLAVVAPPAAPSRPLVTGFTSRTVSLSWSAPRPAPHAPGDISGYIITVSTKAVQDDDAAEFTKSEDGPIHTNSSATRLVLERLQPYTVYAFRVQVLSCT